MTKHNFSSPEFLEKLQSQDHQAIEQLVSAYTTHLVNAAFGMGFGESDASELVQTVWATFFQKVPSFEGRSHVRTYLFGILYNKGKELYRERNKHTSELDVHSFFEDNFDDTGHWVKKPHTPDEFVNQVQTIGIIEDCMNRLPEKYRVAFHMKEVEETRSEEICNILDISATNLRVILYRAKAKLKDCVERKMYA